MVPCAPCVLKPTVARFQLREFDSFVSTSTADACKRDRPVDRAAMQILHHATWSSHGSAHCYLPLRHATTSRTVDQQPDLRIGTEPTWTQKVRKRMAQSLETTAPKAQTLGIQNPFKRAQKAMILHTFGASFGGPDRLHETPDAPRASRSAACETAPEPWSKLLYDSLLSLQSRPI